MLEIILGVNAFLAKGFWLDKTNNGQSFVLQINPIGQLGVFLNELTLDRDMPAKWQQKLRFAANKG